MHTSRYVAIIMFLSLGPLAHIVLFSLPAPNTGILADLHVRYFVVFVAWVMSCAGLFLCAMEYQLFRNYK